MKYIVCQVFNKNHCLSKRIVSIWDTIAEADIYAESVGFSKFELDPKHADTYVTEKMMLMDDNEKIVGASQLIAIAYSEEEAALLASAQMTADSQDSDNDSTEDATESEED